MSDALKPWIKEYFESYVSSYDDLGKIHPKKAKVQILKFLTFPRTDEEFLWASVSDKNYIIPARFTPHAVKMYNENNLNEGRPLTSRRSALAVINSKQILRCRPPLGPQKGLNPSWQLALEVDEVNVIACDGEPQFGKPCEFNEWLPVQTFLQGLAEGRGNVLRKPPDKVLAGEGSGSGTTVIRRNGSASSNDSRSSGGPGRPSPVQPGAGLTFEERHRQWERDIAALGLLRCYEYPEVEFEGLEIKSVLDGPPPPHPQQPRQESTLPSKAELQKASPRMPTNVNYPSTPSQWSFSAAARSSPPNFPTDNERNLSSQSFTGLIPDSQNDGNETDSDGSDEPNHSTDYHLPSIQHMPEAKVLVPDSDISHSQSQPLPIQMLVEELHSPLTMFSIPETSLDPHQNSSHLRDKDCDIAASLSAPEGISKPDRPSAPTSQRGKKRKLSTAGTDEGSQVNQPKQRAESRQPRPLHDPSIWKKPSFMASPVQRDVDIIPQDGDNIQPEKSSQKLTPLPTDAHKAVELKLGGWQPDWSLEKIPGVMTYEKFKALLSRVECKREASA